MSKPFLAIGFYFVCVTLVSSQHPMEQANTTSLLLAKSRHACDFDGFLRAALEAREVRSKRLLSEDQFIKMAAYKGTVILDAREQRHHQQLRLKGSINLPYTSFSFHDLGKAIPDKSTRILIYCRNNFEIQDDSSGPSVLVSVEKSGEPEIDLDVGFSKGHAVGLNIPTFITLREYGYLNVWELKDVIDPRNCKCSLESEQEKGSGLVSVGQGF